MDKPAHLYHHLTERNKGCSHTIVFTNVDSGVGKFPWIAAYASNHVVGVTEVAIDRKSRFEP